MFVARTTIKEAETIMKALTDVQALNISDNEKLEVIGSFIKAIWEAERSGRLEEAFKRMNEVK